MVQHPRPWCKSQSAKAQPESITRQPVGAADDGQRQAVETFGAAMGSAGTRYGTGCALGAASWRYSAGRGEKQTGAKHLGWHQKHHPGESRAERLGPLLRCSS